MELRDSTSIRGSTPPPIPLINGKNDEKPDKYYVKIKLRKETTSPKSDLSESKMALFDNGDPEECLLFIRNFSMTIEESGTLVPSKKIK